MTITSSITYQPNSIPFTKITIYTLSTTVASVFPMANPILNSVTFFNSSGICEVEIVIPLPPKTPEANPTTEEEKEEKEDILEGTKIHTYLIWSFVALTLACSILNMFFPGGSYQNFWSMVNEYQLYQTLLLLGVEVPETLIEFWTDLKFSTFTFGILSFLEFPSPSTPAEDTLDTQQDKKMYSRVGLESGSLVINESYLIGIILLIILIDIIATPCLYLLRRWKKTGRVRKIADKFLSYLHFQVYIRF